MSVFNGILNDNGEEKKIRLFVDFETPTPYNTDFYVDEIYVNAIIEPAKINIQNKNYNYCIKKCDGEVIIAGKEEPSLFHWILPCVCKQIFFVLTNKQEV